MWSGLSFRIGMENQILGHYESLPKTENILGEYRTGVYRTIHDGDEGSRPVVLSPSAEEINFYLFTLQEQQLRPG